MAKVFICSPYRGDVKKNIKLAKLAAGLVIFRGDIPIIPHLYFPQFLKEDNQPERIEGIKMGVELMKDCDELWIVGTNITAGMEFELKTAKEIKITVKLYDENLARIDTDTLVLDERLDDRYREIVKDLTFFRYC
ncbi:MAG: DUF4406 domain-containing protein [Anaerovoracaceae bacterium]|jgi:hypothetical protein